MELTPQEQKKREKIAKLIEEGEFSLLEYLLEIDGAIEEKVKKMEETCATAIEEVKANVPDLDKVLETIKGKDGEDSKVPGPKGETGEAGYTPKKNKDYFDGKDGRNGVDGKDAKPLDKNEVIREVVALIPTPKDGKDGSQDTGEQIREKVQALEEGDRWEIEDVNDLRKELDAIRKLYGGRTILGGASRTRFVDDETLTGTIDGANTIFTISGYPIDSSLKVFRGGARQRVTEDYTVSGKTITFTIAPQVGEILLADYRL